MLRHYFTVGVHGSITRLNWLMLRLRDMHFNTDHIDGLHSWIQTMWSHLHIVCAMILEQWCCALDVDWGFTFDSPDLDASPLAFGGWKRSMSSASLLNSSAACTVFWLLTEHGQGLNVTGISELCTQHNANLWEWDSTPSPGNASIDSDVENPKG